MPKKASGGHENGEEEGFFQNVRKEWDRLVNAGRSKTGPQRDGTAAKKTWFGQPRIVVVAVVFVVWLAAVLITTSLTAHDPNERSNGITRETALDFCRGDQAKKTSEGWRVDVPQENTICLLKRQPDGSIRHEQLPLNGDFKNYQPPRR